MKEFGEETGMKNHLKMKAVGNRMKWAGHVQRMSEDRLSKKEFGKQTKVENSEEDN